VDQYIWSILQALGSSDADEVTIDSAANWKPTKNVPGCKVELDETESCKKIKAMSPGNLPLPSGGGSWDSSGAVMSPFAPDMNSIASGSFMQGYGNNNSGSNNNGPSMTSGSANNNMGRSNSFDFSTELLGGPLSQLADSVNSLDPLSSMEKAINEQVGGGSSSNSSNNVSSGNNNSSNNSSCGPSMPAPPSRDSCGSQNQPHTPQTGPNTPHTPHTPGQQALTPAGGNGPPSVGNPCGGSSNPDLSSGGVGSNNSSIIPDTTSDLPSDLNFDPEAVINGEGSGNESLNLLPDSGVDPMELLSYLEPSGLATPPSSGESNNSNINSTTPVGTSASDDLLSLFD